MNRKNEALRSFKLYAVTDLSLGSNEEIQKIAAAYRGGVDIVQLRSKILSDAALLRAGEKVRKIASRFRKLFFVNDRVDLAILLKADGVHLGQDDMPLADARRLTRRAGVELLCGQSTHDLRQAVRAEKQGADYIGVGPVFATPTKPGKKAVGLAFVEAVSRSVMIPFVAIGGIDLKNVRAVLDAGATRVAVVRAIFSAKDPASAANELKLILER